MEAYPDRVSVLPKLMECINGLHHDTRVVKQLQLEKPLELRSCAQAFSGIYIRRFREDLKIIRSGCELLNPGAGERDTSARACRVQEDVFEVMESKRTSVC